MRPTLASNLLFLFALAGLSVRSAASAEIRRVGENPAEGKSAAVIVPGDLPLVHTTQLLPVEKDGRVVGKEAEVQCAHSILLLKDVLRLTKVSFDQVVALELAAKDLAALETLEKTVAGALGPHPPAVSVVVSDLGHPEALVALDAIAVAPAAGRKAVSFGRIPELPRVDSHLGFLPPGPRIYISGQAEPGELLDAARKTMESLGKTLEGLGRGKSSIVRVRAFVNPMSRADEVRAEIAKFFGDGSIPPIVTIDWKFDSPIEIEVVAWGGEVHAADAQGKDPLEFITPLGMKSSPVFSRVVRINRGPIIYVGGLFGPAGGTPEEQIASIFDQLQTTLQAADSDLAHLVKATYLCTEPDTIKSLGALRPKYYHPERPPGASLSKIPATGRAGTTITLDMIAVPKP